MNTSSLKKNVKKKKGFTLVELIIVIAILGILSTIAIPRFANLRQGAEDAAQDANDKIWLDTAAILQAEGVITDASGSDAIEDAIEGRLNTDIPDTVEFGFDADGRLIITAH